MRATTDAHIGRVSPTWAGVGVCIGHRAPLSQHGPERTGTFVEAMSCEVKSQERPSCASMNGYGWPGPELIVKAGCAGSAGAGG